MIIAVAVVVVVVVVAVVVVVVCCVFFAPTDYQLATLKVGCFCCCCRLKHNLQTLSKPEQLPVPDLDRI